MLSFPSNFCLLNSFTPPPLMCPSLVCQRLSFDFQSSKVAVRALTRTFLGVCIGQLLVSLHRQHGTVCDILKSISLVHVSPLARSLLLYLYVATSSPPMPFTVQVMIRAEPFLIKAHVKCAPRVKNSLRIL